MERVIVTVVGKDTVGIIGKVCTYLSSVNVNVLDISQTIVSDYFNMMMVVDVANLNVDFAACQEELKNLGEEIGVQIIAQREEIFEMMHRI